MNDKIIQFPNGGATNGDRPPGKKGEKPVKKSKAAAAPSPDLATPMAPIDPATLSEDQKKALQIVISGMPFVAIGIKSTTTGADFFTAIHGEPEDLRNSAPHLSGVIERALGRKGI